MEVKLNPVGVRVKEVSVGSCCGKLGLVGEGGYRTAVYFGIIQVGIAVADKSQTPQVTHVTIITLVMENHL